MLVVALRAYKRYLVIPVLVGRAGDLLHLLGVYLLPGTGQAYRAVHGGGGEFLCDEYAKLFGLLGREHDGNGLAFRIEAEAITPPSTGKHDCPAMSTFHSVVSFLRATKARVGG